MIGKISLALIRREANTYRSHGLSEEAADLYKKLLASSPNLSPEIKADIEYHLKQIDLEIGCDALEECQAISDEQIAVIKKGWRDQSTFDEILTSAMTFYQIGRFGDALGELKKLRRNFDELEQATGEIAACLIQLYDPEGLPVAVDQLTIEFFNDPKEILSIQAAIAEKMAEWGHSKHARSLLRHIKLYKNLPCEIQNRIHALSRKIGITYSFKEACCLAPTGGQPSRNGTNDRSILGRIWETAKLFKQRLISKGRNAQ
jgi:tetratricopeptide (TPR) repeat protein